MMQLTKEDGAILAGKRGEAARKSMEILVALGDIYGAKDLVDVASVQVAGVSYHNLGDAGLEFLSELAKDGQVKVLTTLNPAGMDLENWKALGISEDFAKKQNLVIDAFRKMGIITCCTCTPYLAGNLPTFGQHLAWSESSAVTFANSIIGARTNREGGPSALAAAIIGKTPAYGLHLDENRKPVVHVEVQAKIRTMPDWGALGYAIGKKAEGKVPYITGLQPASTDELKSFCASVVTYGGAPLFHIPGITPEASQHKQPAQKITITEADIADAKKAIDDPVNEIEFVCLGCPHCSIDEVAKIAALLKGKKVKAEFWVAASRNTKALADSRGYSAIIEAAGGKWACDTCLAVAPLKGRFKSVATTSAKGCFYCRGSNAMATRMGTVEQCINAAITGRWA